MREYFVSTASPQVLPGSFETQRMWSECMPLVRTLYRHFHIFHFFQLFSASQFNLSVISHIICIVAR